jgi:hypothetical protein
MYPRLLQLGVVLAVLQSTACGQEGTPAETPVQPVQQAQDAASPVQQTDAEFRAEVGQKFDALNKRLDEISQALGQEKPPMATIESTPSTPTPSPKTIEERVKALEDLTYDIFEQQAEQGNRLGQIAMQGEGGAYHVRFDTNSQSGRHEIRRAIESTVPEHGHFIVRNRTPYYQDIYVNGRLHQVAPNKDLTLDVQPGAVTTQLVGQQVNTWQVGLPSFKQVVDILWRQPQYQYVARWVSY